MKSAHRKLCVAALLGFMCCAAGTAQADEFGFSSYGLGGAAFGAGATPPPGTYITAVAAHYKGDINSPITLGGVILDFGVKAELFSAAINGLHVFERKVLGGNLGVSVTIPVGHLDLAAQVIGPLGNTITRQTDGGGLGDITTRLQLGWAHQNFAHTVYVQAVAPTGRYNVGFEPNIGLNRPGLDVGWAFTWVEPTSKLQFNGSFGVTFNFENEKTDYKSGTDFHFEWAIGYEIAKSLTVGPVGYHFRQLTGDSGPGAVLGPFEGSVDAIGAGASFTTLVGATPLILNLRHYQEFNSENRLEGRLTIFTGTIRF